MTVIDISKKCHNTNLVVNGNGNIGKLFAINSKVDTWVISRFLNDSQCMSLITPRGKKTRTLKLVQATEINKEIRFIVMATKAYDLAAALNAIKSNLSEKTVIILTQNGLGFHEKILKLFPKCCIVFASITYGVKKYSDLAIYSDMKGSVKLGIISQVKNDLSNKREISKLFRSLELNWLWSDNINQDILLKFAINCIINPLSIIYNCENGELESIAGFSDTIEKLASEIVLVLKNLETSVDELIKQVYKVIAETRHNISSTLADYKQQKKTEIEFFNIHLTRLADKNKVDIRTNCAMLSIITQLTK
ncbi:MAG: 2-dehydropantoate 2-reductase [Pseudomonadota bacterium]|nr:2-dehydropantoate 2-reductase [Pseudomonadota bacterium]